ncbi:MAG TPA: hypothetical protein VGK11_06770 [Actinomycetota bacterium]
MRSGIPGSFHGQAEPASEPDPNALLGTRGRRSVGIFFLASLVAAAVNDYLLARVPHLVAGDAVGLRSQGARAMGWFATLGAATPLTLFLVGWVGETRAPYTAVALPLLVILAVTAFIFALRGYRDARAALSEDLSRHG